MTKSYKIGIASQSVILRLDPKRRTGGIQQS
jgi:hypothetical protein